MTLTADQFADFALSSIAGGAGGIGTTLNTADTTLYVQSGNGALFPASGPFMVLLGSPIANGSHEIVKCTARVSDTLTVVRAQEGTAVKPWGVNTTVQGVATAGNFSNLWTQLSQAVYPDAAGAIAATGGVALGQTPSAYSLVANTSISTFGSGVIRVTSTTNVTGITLKSGSYSGQFMTVANEGAFTVTFASTSSLVADGATSAIPAHAGRGFVWDGSTGLWYRLA